MLTLESSEKNEIKNKLEKIGDIDSLMHESKPCSASDNSCTCGWCCTSENT